MKPKLRNPGLYSFLIVLACVGLVVALAALKVDDAGKLAASLIGIVAAGFGAKSALHTEAKPKTATERIADAVMGALTAPPADESPPPPAVRPVAMVPPPMRPKLVTWPDDGLGTDRDDIPPAPETRPEGK